MYKSLKFLSFLLAFFLGSLFYPMFCKAEALPEIATATFEVIEGGMQDAIIGASNFKGLSAYSDSIIATYEVVSACLKQVSNSTWDSVALWSCDTDDCVTRLLTDEEKSSLSEFDIVDRNGQSVDLDDVYAVIYDNGFFHGNCYVDSSGYMLYENNANFVEGSTVAERHLCNIVYGGSLCDVGDWNNFFDLLVDNVTDNNMVFNADPENFVQGPKSYYVWFGFQNKNVPPYQEWVIYIPNQYNPGVIVPQQTTNGGQITSWYTNDPSIIVENQVHGNPYVMKVVTQGNYTLGGNSYSYSVYIRNSGYSYVGSSGYNSFINYSGPNGCLFNRTGNVLNASNFNNNNYSFLPLNVPSIIPNPINEDIIYPIETVKQLQFEDNPSANQQYNPNSPTDPNNYPLNVPNASPINYPSFLTNPIPSANPNVNPALDPSLNYETIEQPSSSDVESALGNYFVPFLENIFNRYPFSIPWDIRDFILSFQSEPLPPAWNFDWTISIGSNDYTKHFEGDLSDFNGLAEIFRSLMLISFIFFLAKFSYDHHF